MPAFTWFTNTPLAVLAHLVDSVAHIEKLQPLCGKCISGIEVFTILARPKKDARLALFHALVGKCAKPARDCPR